MRGICSLLVLVVLSATASAQLLQRTSKEKAADWEKNPSNKALQGNCNGNGASFTHYADFKRDPKANATTRIAHLVRNHDKMNSLPVKWPIARWLDLKWIAEAGIDFHAFNTGRDVTEIAGEILYGPQAAFKCKAGTYSPAPDKTENKDGCQDDKKTAQNKAKVIPLTQVGSDIAGLPRESIMYSELVNPKTKAKHTIDFEATTSIVKQKNEYHFMYEFKNNGGEVISIEMSSLAAKITEMRKIKGIFTEGGLENFETTKKLACAPKEVRKIAIKIIEPTLIKGFTERYLVYRVFIENAQLNQGIMTLYFPEAK